MSSSNRQVGKLQEDNSQKTWQEQWGLWGTLSGFITTTAETSPTRTSLDRRNMVQAEGWYNCTNKGDNICIKEDCGQESRQTRNIHTIDNIHSNTSIYNKSTSKHTIDANKQDHNNNTSTIYTWQDRRLLDTRRTHVEESPHTTTQWAIRSTTNTTWTRHHKAQAWQSFFYASTRWNKDDKIWW